MAKKDIVIFICDCGNKEFQFENKVKNSQLREVYIPSKSFDCEGRGYTKGISKDFGVVHFTSEETAEAAIEEIVKPFIAEHPDFDVTKM